MFDGEFLHDNKVNRYEGFVELDVYEKILIPKATKM